MAAKTIHLHPAIAQRLELTALLLTARAAEEFKAYAPRVSQSAVVSAILEERLLSREAIEEELADLPKKLVERLRKERGA